MLNERRLARAAASALGVALCCGSVLAANPPSKDQALAGQREYRRRGGHCMNSSVYRPAMRESRLPRDIGDTPVIVPHLRQRFGKLVCYTVAADGLWAADDQTVFHVRTDGRTVRRFDASHGLTDHTVQAIAVTAGGVWLATLGGLARLDPEAGTIETVPGVTFTIGEFATHGNDAWLVTDAGTWRLTAAQTWQKLSDFPGQERLATSVRAGFWWFRWHNKEIRLIADAFATADGFYLLHERTLYHRGGGKWTTVTRNAWRAMPQGRIVWALCTQGVYRYDPDAGSGRLHKYGDGPAVGRPVAMAADDAFFLASHGNYNPKARRFGGFSGGGISRFHNGKWTVTNRIGDVNVHFPDSLHVHNGDVLAGVMLYDKPVQRGAHPGMAHVKRWDPHPSGLGLARFHNGEWSVVTRRGLKTLPRWMGPHGIGVHLDVMGPQHVDHIACTGGRVWGVYRVFPEKWYGGYYPSAGCLACKKNGKWEPVFDLRTEQLGLAGEHPGLLGMSRSHGGVYLAEGHLRVLGVEAIGGRCWVISHAGIHVYDAARDRFVPVVEQADRLYFRAMCAAPAPDAVWFGGCGDTVSRLDRKTGRLKLVGVVPGRTIVAIRADAGTVSVSTAPGKATLPATLADAPRLPAADMIVFGGKAWKPGTGKVSAPKTAYTCGFKAPHGRRRRGRRQVNYLRRGGKRIAFIKGVFRPKVLAEDPIARKLWIATYGGVLSVPLPAP
ncbi:MAG: hypothetical protein R6V58_13190 [Planctomycetota bacterium]